MPIFAVLLFLLFRIYIWIQNRISWFVFVVLKRLRVHSGSRRGCHSSATCRLRATIHPQSFRYAIYAYITHNTNNTFFFPFQRMFDVLNISFHPSNRTILYTSYITLYQTDETTGVLLLHRILYIIIYTYEVILVEPFFEFRHQNDSWIPRIFRRPFFISRWFV